VLFCLVLFVECLCEVLDDEIVDDGVAIVMEVGISRSAVMLNMFVMMFDGMVLILVFRVCTLVL